MYHYRVWTDGLMKVVTEKALQKVTMSSAGGPVPRFRKLSPMETEKAGLLPGSYRDLFYVIRAISPIEEEEAERQRKAAAERQVENKFRHKNIVRFFRPPPLSLVTGY